MSKDSKLEERLLSLESKVEHNLAHKAEQRDLVALTDCVEGRLEAIEQYLGLDHGGTFKGQPMYYTDSNIASLAARLDKLESHPHQVFNCTELRVGAGEQVDTVVVRPTWGTAESIPPPMTGAGVKDECIVD